MTTYFEAPDGHGESCIWMHTDSGPWCLLSKSDVAGTDVWPDVVARITGTTAQQLETATIQLKTMSGVVDQLRADMRRWANAAAERTRERDEATDQLQAMTRACDAYRADRDELSELLAKANDGTTITTDDATVERIAATMYPELMNHDERDEPAEWATADGPHRDQWLEAARAVLAALTGDRA